MRATFLAAALLASAPAWAQSVALHGMLGNRALLIVDGSAPKTVAPGEAHKGVKVVSTAGDQAVVEIGGKRHTLRVGEAPASVGGTGGAAPAGHKIVLTRRQRRPLPHRRRDQRPRRLLHGRHRRHQHRHGRGRRRAAGHRLQVRPAGAAWARPTASPLGWRVKLASVRIGEVEVRDVDAVVGPQPMPYILLGNSFLNRFQMQRDNDQMVLERRY